MHKKIYITFFIIIIAGFFIRLYQLDEHGIWGDEKASLQNALGIPLVPVDDTVLVDFPQLKDNWKGLNFSKGEIFTSVNFWSFNTPSNVYKSCFISNGSILYSFALHYWIRIFGPTDFWVRFLSLVFGCLIVLLTFYIADLLFRSYKIALFASALVALHPLFVSSSQLTRSHSMAAFFTLLATYFLFRIIQYNKNKLSVEEDGHRIYSIGVWRAGTKYLFIAYTLAVLISLLSHYITAYVFIGHFLMMILLVRDRSVWVNYMLANVVVIVIFGLWLYKGGGRGSLEIVVASVHNKYGELAHNWKQGDNPYFMPATFSNIITCWVQVLLPLFGNYCQSLGFRIRELAVLLFIPLSFLFIGFYRNTDIEKNKLLSALIILSIMFPVFATIVALRYYHLTVFMPTYSVYAAPFAIILLAYGINKITVLNKNWKWVFYTLAGIQIILILLSLLPIYSNYWHKRGTNPYVVLSDSVKKLYRDKDIVVYPSWDDAFMTNLFLKNHNNILQKIDTTLNDKVLLVKNNTFEKIELFDFQNGKLRY